MASDRNSAEWVRKTVIETVRNGADTVRSGAWLAERDELGNIQIYCHDEKLECSDNGGHEVRADGGPDSDDTEHPEPVENVGFNEEVIQHVDYLLWSHGASNAVRARIKAEMRGERPPECAVDTAGDLGQAKPPAECSCDTDTDREGSA